MSMIPTPLVAGLSLLAALAAAAYAMVYAPPDGAVSPTVPLQYGVTAALVVLVPGWLRGIVASIGRWIANGRSRPPP